MNSNPRLWPENYDTASRPTDFCEILLDGRTIINSDMLLLFSVSRPYAMPELWGGGVPTSDSGQFSPRLWVPSPYSLSPTRRSEPEFQWKGTNARIHRQWQQGTKRTKDRHGGPQFTYGSSVTSLVTGGTVLFSEQPGETITHQRENSLLCVGLNI